MFHKLDKPNGSVLLLLICREWIATGLTSRDQERGLTSEEYLSTRKRWSILVG